MDEISVSIHTDGGPVSVLDFAEYFRFLRGCYVLALERTKFEESYNEEHEDDAEDVVVAPPQVTAESLASQLSSSSLAMSPSEIEQYIYKHLSKSEDLSLLNIKRHNPFEVVFSGISIALTAAIIVSGGKFKLGPGGINIEIPPLGDGIKRLRDALIKQSRQEE